MGFLLPYCGVTVIPKGQDHFLTAYTLSDVQRALLNLQEGAVIFIDVDDTLITPQSKLFRHLSPYRFLIDDLKKNKDQFSNFEIILSHWRLQRKTILVSEEWPALINTLKNTYPVYGLTKMETGSIGAIPSMEEWRYGELREKGISFTFSYEGDSQKILIAEAPPLYSALFYQGFFITGSFSKGEVVGAFLKTQRPPQIVLIDDRPEHVQDVSEECSRHAIPFLGISFKGAELLSGQPDSKIAEFQKQWLFQQAEWVEDEEAKQQLYPNIKEHL